MRIFTTILLLCMITACGVTVEDSAGTLTGDVYLDVYAERTGDLTLLSAQLKKGNIDSTTYLELTGGDTLRGKVESHLDYQGTGLFNEIKAVEGLEKDLEDKESNIFSEVVSSMLDSIFPSGPSYKATFKQYDYARPVKLSFDRNEQQDAMNTTFTVPPMVTITTSTGIVYSRASGFTLDWALLGNTIDVYAIANCQNGSGGSFSWSQNYPADTGQAVISAVDMATLTGACDLTISVSRSSTTGQADPALGGGRFKSRASVKKTFATID